MDNFEYSNDTMYMDDGISFINTVKDVGLSINMIVITITLTIFYNPETYKLTGKIFKKAPFVKITKEMYLFMIHTFLVTLILGLFFYFKDNYILQKVEEENGMKIQSALAVEQSNAVPEGDGEGEGEGDGEGEGEGDGEGEGEGEGDGEGE